MEKIELHNYRCYQEISLSFKKKVNLLIGDNSSGKTTLLRAIRSVLSSFFTGYSDENTRFVGLSKEDFTVQETKVGFADEKNISIHFKLLGIEGDLILKSIKGRTLTKPLSEIYEYGKELKERVFDETLDRREALPIWASFSTEDIHSKGSIKMAPFKQYSHKPSFGYYECLQGDGFFQFWIKRLLVLKEGRNKSLEISCVHKAIQLALGKEGCNIIFDMDIRPNQGKVYYYFIDGREVEAENLSDGYKRLVNIVTDLAFRCAILNDGLYGEESCLKTFGTVLIDEIDLHLHPTLQSSVLTGLANAFPNIQFIVTTHAPMIMTGIKSDKDNLIYKLSYSERKGYDAHQVNLYGMDASDIIEGVLHTTPRSKEVDQLLSVLFDLIDDDKYEEAMVVFHNMKKEFGDKLPDLARAESMLNFLKPEK